jgi:hypothetical protein
MDIAAFNVTDTAKITIVSPATNKATDFVIEIHGLYSDRFKKSYSEFLKRNPGGDLNSLDPEFLADMTEGWKGATNGGKAFKFTKARALEVYIASKPIKAQLRAAILKGSGFLADA